jgi:hypothetical protein
VLIKITGPPGADEGSELSLCPASRPRSNDLRRSLARRTKDSEKELLLPSGRTRRRMVAGGAGPATPRQRPPGHMLEYYSAMASEPVLVAFYGAGFARTTPPPARTGQADLLAAVAVASSGGAGVSEGVPPPAASLSLSAGLPLVLMEPEPEPESELVQNRSRRVSFRDEGAEPEPEPQLADGDRSSSSSSLRSTGECGSPCGIFVALP